MSDIIRLPKEVAELISELRADGWSDGRIFEAAVKRNFGSRRFDPLSEIPIDTLAKALFIEFEIELTPEDKVRDRYNRYVEQMKMYQDRGQRSDELHWEGRANGIRDCLFDLNIKIKGVNAE